jgi:hypothetical protein
VGKRHAYEGQMKSMMPHGITGMERVNSSRIKWNALTSWLKLPERPASPAGTFIYLFTYLFHVAV